MAKEALSHPINRSETMNRDEFNEIMKLVDAQLANVEGVPFVDVIHDEHGRMTQAIWSTGDGWFAIETNPMQESREYFVNPDAINRILYADPTR